MGSSWQPDEDIIIPYFNSHPEMEAHNRST